MSSEEQAQRAASRIALLRVSPDAVKHTFVTLLTQGPISRVDIAHATGLSQGAITKAANPLIRAGLVTDAQRGVPDGQPGRPANPLRVVPDALLAIGIKINGDEVVAVLTDLLTTVQFSVHIPLSDREVDTVVTGVSAALDRIQGELGDTQSAVLGIGVAVSGDVNSEGGVVRESALMGWRDIDLRKLMAQFTELPVIVVNDVHALTLGEHWFGVGVGTDSFAIVTIGRGIGCGLHLNGDVVEGALGVAGEIGHLPLTSLDRVCNCGRFGCVEAIASTEAITRDLSNRVGKIVSIDEAVLMARLGNPDAQAVFAEAASVIGRAIATVVNLTGPELVLLGGEGTRNFDLYEDRLREAFEAHVFGAAAKITLVVRPHTFEDWARGAAAAAIRDLVQG